MKYQRKIDPGTDAEMDPRIETGLSSNPRELGQAIREVVYSFRNLLKSEIDLVSAEVRDSVHQVTKDFRRIVIFGGIAALGILPFLAFCVIGLGHLLDNKFWLSSLIVAIFCFLVGGSVAFASYKKLRKRDLSLPETKETLQQEMDRVGDKIHDIRSVQKRRAS